MVIATIEMRRRIEAMREERSVAAGPGYCIFASDCACTCTCSLIPSAVCSAHPLSFLKRKEKKRGGRRLPVPVYKTLLDLRTAQAHYSSVQATAILKKKKKKRQQRLECWMLDPFLGCPPSHQPHAKRGSEVRARAPPRFYFPLKMRGCLGSHRTGRQQSSAAQGCEGDGERESSRKGSMADWGPVIVATVLFVVLTPGLLCTLPGRGRVAEFGSMHTSGVAIIVHAVLYFALITIFLVAVGIHVYAG
ncbi:hypothetical protein BS78_06G068300 [Paspalum vaginatum]|nr:hypothetical protein BS78_06G068300 [Paspalum vaginatum]